MSMTKYEIDLADINLRSDLNDICILPTNQLVKYLFGYAQAMNSHDYDIDEIIRLCLDALVDHSRYPHTFQTQVRIPSLELSGFDENDFIIINEMLRCAYDTIYWAICATGLYNNEGILTCNYFTIYDNDVVLFSLG